MPADRVPGVPEGSAPDPGHYWAAGSAVAVTRSYMLK
jgi:hypothetical protein